MSECIILSKDTPSIIYLKNRDKRLAKVIDLVGEISYIPHNDPYHFLIHEIVEQMLSIKAGNKIFSRLENLCDNKITPKTIQSLSDSDIRSTGMSTAKVTYIRHLTDAVLTNQIDLFSLYQLSDAEVIKTLTKIKGIGNWTAKMFLIFVLNRPDILPYEDGAFVQSYKWMYKKTETSKSEIQKKCKKWSPYSSIATRYLYRALDIGLTKEEFHLFKGE